MEVTSYERGDLSGIVSLCECEHWDSYTEDPERTHRTLTAPGVTAVVAREKGAVVGFAYVQGDGEIQAHLSLIVVAASRRRGGIARQLLARAHEVGGGRRIDLVTDDAADFYEALHHRRMKGYRIYPPFT